MIAKIALRMKYITLNTFSRKKELLKKIKINELRL
jgi:hypothetical protein